MLKSLAATGIVTVLLAMSAPAAIAGSSRSEEAGSSIPKCLVGTWHDNAGTTSTEWDGHRVTMHAGGGDVDHITAKGVDHDNWYKSKPAYGTYQGSRLKETIRGINKITFTVSKGKIHVTEDGWNSKATNKYVYRGQHSTGYLNQTGHSTVRYRCTAKKLTYLNKKGKVTGTETRKSRKP